MESLSIGFVLPYGEASEGFFPDELLAILCGDARAAGHRAASVRVYYDGRDPSRDREVARRLEHWLGERAVDVVVVDRLFDPAPIRAHVAAGPARRVLLVTRGDSVDPIEGVDFVVGGARGVVRGGATRRSATLGELRLSFVRTVDAIACGRDPLDVPGVASCEGGVVRGRRPLEAPSAAMPLRAALVDDTISLGPPPRVRRATVFGNAGCPFADDPLENPHYANVRLPVEAPIARRGCAFCCMGGDYEKRPDAEVVIEMVEQALQATRANGDIDELVLADQHPLRYLATLVREAARAGVRPVRWLFPARADSFVRERSRVVEAIRAAHDTGHVIEVYLSGFEAFSDEELSRYNKGVTVADLLAAVTAMRELREEFPASFDYARARGHSLILWNPWTTPANLRETLEAVRAAGLAELFNELGRNRLRLYSDLPIHYAAERDGALVAEWEEGDEGAGRRKGYTLEHPWRFLDARTKVAYSAARALRDRLGHETEIAQLQAAVDFAESLPEGTDGVDALERVRHGFDALERAIDAIRERRAGGESERAAFVSFSGACNNGCAGCPNLPHWSVGSHGAVMTRIDAARAKGLPVVLAGREPTLSPFFIDAVARARGDDGRCVGVVTNARRFAYRAFAVAAVRAGLSAASVKLFAPSAAAADAISRAEGGHEQALAGIASLRAAGVAVEIRAPLHASNLGDAESWPELARRIGARALWVEIPVDGIGLAHLSDAAAALTRIAERAAEWGVPLEIEGLQGGGRVFDRVVRRRPG